MQEIQDRACAAANRVDIAAGFVTGASEKNRLVSCILDTFRVAQDLLLDVSQTGQRDEFVRFVGGGHQLLSRSPDEIWSEFVVSQINLWHAAKLNHRAVATTGDLLSAWQPTSMDAEILDDAFQQLEFIVMFDPEAVAERWANEPDRDELIHSVSLCVRSIAVIASNNTVVDTTEAFTGVSFGASLLAENAEKLVACHVH